MRCWGSVVWCLEFGVRREGSVLGSRVSTHKCEAVPRRARIQGSYTCVSLNSGLESNEEEEMMVLTRVRGLGSGVLSFGFRV